jgi:hypothetical protein
MAARGLDLGHPPGLQPRLWRAQRAAWAGMALVAGLAAAGLLGTGPLSGDHAEAAAGGIATRLAFEAVARVRSPHPMDLAVEAPAGTGPTLALEVPAAYLDAMTLNSAAPEPSRGEATPRGVRWTWDVGSWEGPVEVALEWSAHHWGPVQATLLVEAGDAEPLALEVRQVVLP